MTNIMHLVKLILKANGKKGVPQGGIISPLLSNLYLNEVDEMMERAREVTRSKGYDNLDFIRSADDMVILVHGHPKEDWLLQKVQKRLQGRTGQTRGTNESGEDESGRPQRGRQFQFSGV